MKQLFSQSWGTETNAHSRVLNQRVSDALQERLTTAGLTREHGLQANIIGLWKKQFFDNAIQASDNGKEPGNKNIERERDALYKKVSRLQISST